MTLNEAGWVIAAEQDAMPEGSRIVYANGLWNVYRGHGSAYHGAGRTLEGAIARIGATVAQDATGHRVEYAPDGSVIPPEETDRRSPNQDEALEQAFVAAKLPEEDRRPRTRRRTTA